MSQFDRVIIIVMIFGTGLLSGVTVYTESKKFTCEQLSKVYLNGECVELKMENK